MSDGWTLKRFWTEVAVAPVAGGFAVTLDGKPVRTPGKVPLLLPTRALAQMVAAEWQAQEGLVRPATMPATRTANTALDTLPKHRAAIVADLSGYGATDLLCYRAGEPAGLCARQAAGWDPLLDWAALRYGARLRSQVGVMPVAQDEEALAALAAEVARQDDFQLAAFHDLVQLSGSLIIALAVAEGVRSPEEAWELSRIDETWQAEQWGKDDDAEAAADLKRAAFVHASLFHSHCGQANAPSTAHS
jgi:chaperone required for assembly of F1-ATPase